MAEPRRFLSSFSQRQAGSDAAFEYECDPCKFEGTVSEGISFCNECKEFLCDVCWRAHRKSRASRDHDVVQGAALRQTLIENESQTQGEGPALDFEFCLKHRRKVVSFYCFTHDAVFCTDCKVIEHGSCEGVENIASAIARAGWIQISKEAETFTEQIKSMTDRLAELSDDRKGHLSDIDACQRKCLKDISSLRDELNKLLDRLENEMKQTFERLVSKERKQLQKDISGLHTIRKSLERDRKDFDTANSLGSNKKLFVALKKSRLHELMSPLDAFGQYQCIAKIYFKRHPLIQEVLSSLRNFGSFETHFSEQSLNQFLPSMREGTLKQVSEQNVQESDDSEVCRITGSTFLPSGECILCDFNNDKVKLLDEDARLLTSLTLTSWPWDVALVTEHEAVVSLPGEKRLQCVLVPELKLDRKIKVGRPCLGLAVHKDQIFVTCHDTPGNGQVRVMTKDGVIQRIVEKTSVGSELFTCPYYIALDARGERMYVSDELQHSVTCLTRDGEVVYHRVPQGAVYAHCLLVDAKDGALVCFKDSKTARLQFLTPDGQPYRTLKTWPLAKWKPFTFCYRASDRTLLLGMWDNRKILVYRFE